MPKSLIIDTATEFASICVADGDAILFSDYNAQQKEHASWLHPAISRALEHCSLKPRELGVIGLVAGPGSYTGIRVAMSAAKGLAYTLNIPIVAVNTLEAMAYANLSEPAGLLCPLIDARRMEVFTAMYNHDLEEVISPAAIILDENSFSEQLKKENVLFFGSGKNKLENLLSSKSAIYKNYIFNTADIVGLIHERYIKYEFASLAYLEPIYLKEHYTLFSSKS